MCHSAVFTRKKMFYLVSKYGCTCSWWRTESVARSPSGSPPAARRPPAPPEGRRAARRVDRARPPGEPLPRAHSTCSRTQPDWRLPPPEKPTEEARVREPGPGWGARAPEGTSAAVQTGRPPTPDPRPPTPGVAAALAGLRERAERRGRAADNA